MGMQTKKLAELCNYTRGLTYKKADESAQGTVKILRANNITLNSGLLNFDDVKSLRDDLHVPRDKFVKRDSLLICTASGSKKHLGKVAYIDQNYSMAFGGFMGMLTPNDLVYPKYLYWFTRSKEYSDFVSNLSDGANINNLRFNQLAELQIPVPSLAEQKQIVTILDEAFDDIDHARELAERNLNNARELFHSNLNQVFSHGGAGWREELLSEHCDITHGYAFKSEDFSASNDEDLPIVITPGNFTENSDLAFWEKNTKRFIGSEIPPKFSFELNDLVVVMTDLSSKMKILGKPAFIKRENILHNQRIGLVSLKSESLIKEYIYYFMQTESFLNNIKSTATGTMVKHTAPKRILQNRITYPDSWDEQKAIAIKLNHLRKHTEALECLYQQKIAALDELKQSLLQKAFRGELTQGLAAA